MTVTIPIEIIEVLMAVVGLATGAGIGLTIAMKMQTIRRTVHREHRHRALKEAWGSSRKYMMVPYPKRTMFNRLMSEGLIYRRTTPSENTEEWSITKSGVRELEKLNMMQVLQDDESL